VIPCVLVMSEYWNAVACGAVLGCVVGFVGGCVWATHVWSEARRKVDQIWDGPWEETKRVPPTREEKT